MKDEKVEEIKVKVPTKFEDIGVTEIFPKATQRDLKDVMGKKIILKDFIELPSTFGGNFVVALAELNGKDISFPIGSKVVLDQLHKVKEMDKFPIEATIIEKQAKEGRTYQTLS